MLVWLRSEWLEGGSIPALISLRDELGRMLQRIRTSRNIQTPIITYRRCGTTGQSAEPHVSVRAVILAVARCGIASKDQARRLEKVWAECRKQHRLDIKGKVPPGCREAARIDDRGRGGSFRTNSADVQKSERVNGRGMMVR